MAVDYAPPRYVQLVRTIQDRISSGEYQPGSLMPSEHQLLSEFGVSRATVVRALQVLRAGGWIESQQGKGSFVRGRPADSESGPRRGQEIVDRSEAAGSVTVIYAGPEAAPAPVVAVLGLGSDPSAVLRRTLAHDGGGEPVELVAEWFRPEVADGTDLGSRAPLPDGIRAHLEARKRIRVDRVHERVSARMPSTEEARLLGMGRRTPVLTLTVTAYDSAGAPVSVTDVVLPADRHDLEDGYPVT